jgi:type I restriction enzyme S subunit
MKIDSREFGELYKTESRNGIWKTSSFIGRGTPYVKMNELFSKKFISSEGNYELIELEEREKEKLLLDNDDLLFSRTSVVPEGVGKCSIICDLKDELAFDSNIIRVRLNNQLCNPKFIFYYFNSPFGRGQILSLANGAAVKTIKGSDLKKLKLNLLELPTQRKIASILSAYDDLIENNLKRIKLLEEKAFLRYKQIVREEKLEKYILSDFGDIITGKTPSTTISDYFGDDVPFIKTPDMHNQIFIEHTDQMLSELGAKSQEKKFLPPLTLCVSCIGTAGVVGITSKPSQTNQQINSIVFNEPNNVYFFYALMSQMKEQLDALGSNGSTFTNVNKNKFENMEVFVPNQKTLNEFAEEFEAPFKLILTLQKQNTKLREARDILLPKLMSGQIEV